jgi:hypothetical protein
MQPDIFEYFSQEIAIMNCGKISNYVAITSTANSISLVVFAGLQVSVVQQHFKISEP